MWCSTKISEIVSEAATAVAAKGKATTAKSGGGGGRRGCELF